MGIDQGYHNRVQDPTIEMLHMQAWNGVQYHAPFGAESSNTVPCPSRRPRPLPDLRACAPTWHLWLGVAVPTRFYLEQRGIQHEDKSVYRRMGFECERLIIANCEFIWRSQLLDRSNKVTQKLIRSHICIVIRWARCPLYIPYCLAVTPCSLLRPLPLAHDNNACRSIAHT